jgi:hypothetical protein
MWELQHLTTLLPSRSCYGDSFSFLHVDNVRSSLETHAFTASYGDCFTVAFLESSNVFFYFFWSGVEFSPLLPRPSVGLLYQSRMTGDNECGAIGGMNNWH